jgi:hypothetical protein
MGKLCVFLLFLCLGSPVALAQGLIRINVPVLGLLEVFLGTNNQGVNVVFLGSIQQPGWTWKVGDFDGDNIVDDVRIEAPDGGKADCVNGERGSGAVNGPIHDGNVPYPNNQIPGATWLR